MRSSGIRRLRRWTWCIVFLLSNTKIQHACGLITTLSCTDRLRNTVAPTSSCKRPQRRHQQDHQKNTCLYSFSDANHDQDEHNDLDAVQRIFCISDLHTDSPENMSWLEDKCLSKKSSTTTSSNALPGKNDLLVVAGDISHDMNTFRTTLHLLKSLGCHVFFVPGNHEAWMTTTRRRTNSSALPPSSSSLPKNSLEKLQLVQDTCRQMGVYTNCHLVGRHSSHPLWLVPLQSWYDGSLSIQGCQDLCTDFGRWPWSDFLRCSWPSAEFPLRPLDDENARIPIGLHDYFLQSNEAALDAVRADDRMSSMSSTGIMTVSHFLPNSQCLPDWKDVDSSIFRRDDWLDHGAAPISAKFAKVAGSRSLDDQIRSLRQSFNNPRKSVHVFGHSHRPKDFVFQGIRYIHNPLGKPREREMHMVSPNVDFQLVWDTRIGEMEGERIIRYWEDKGGGKTALIERLQKLNRQREAWSRPS